MPIILAEARAVFEGSCAPEEADALLDWLRATPAPVIDLSACSGLHTALVQLLLAAPVRIAAPPADPWLAALLPSTLPPEPDPATRPARRRRRTRSDAEVTP